MTRRAALLAVLALAACGPSAAPVVWSAPVESARSVEPGDSTRIAVWQGNIGLWRRSENACYLSIDVPGYKTMFVDVTGPICTDAHPPTVVIGKDDKPAPAPAPQATSTRSGATTASRSRTARAR